MDNTAPEDSQPPDVRLGDLFKGGATTDAERAAEPAHPTQSTPSSGARTRTVEQQLNEIRLLLWWGLVWLPLLAGLIVLIAVAVANKSKSPY